MLKYSFYLDLINCDATRFLSYLLRESPHYFSTKPATSKNITNQESWSFGLILLLTIVLLKRNARAFLVIIALPYAFCVTLCFLCNLLKENWSHYGFYTADVARDKRQPEDTTESFIPDLSYWETWFLIVIFYSMHFFQIRSLAFVYRFLYFFINCYLMTLVNMLKSIFQPLILDSKVKSL